MPLVTRTLANNFAGDISGIDLKKPVDAATMKEIIAAMDRFGVCVYRGQNLTDEEHIAFTRNFGKCETRPTVGKEAKHLRFRYAELFDAGNVDVDGNILAADDRQRSYSQGNRFWHTDSSFRPVRASYSLLRALIIPPADADTQFADMRGAYEVLPETMKKRIENLVAEHWVWHSRMLGGHKPTETELRDRPPVHHRLIHIHPGSGRKSLYLSAHAAHIVGMPIDEGRALMQELTELATRPQFVYTHKWQVGDLVIWDNRCTMHRATPFADLTHKRDLRRTSVSDPDYKPIPREAAQAAPALA
jgi:alpha-ketoglutarate-dependent 2,4-dichlorophenoxyacetate dioxygenase